MKIRIKRMFEDEEVIDLIEYVKNFVNGDNYDGGIVEDARATADNVGLLLGKLIDVLVTKNILAKEDLLKLFKNDLEKIKLWEK